MSQNIKTLKGSKINNTKKEIIELRIKNKFYNKHTVIDKVIDEILFDQFIDIDTKTPKSHP